MSTGTHFYKLLAEAQRRRESEPTAAETADHVKGVIESWTPLHVERITLKHGVDMIVVGKLTEK
jgi:hypothetical protein